jgi:hypothetical protein
MGYHIESFVMMNIACHQVFRDGNFVGAVQRYWDKDRRSVWHDSAGAVLPSERHALMTLVGTDPILDDVVYFDTKAPAG